MACQKPYVTVTMGTSMSISSLILFPEAEMKVGIILMLQMWELRHLKAKKLALIQQQIRGRRAVTSPLTPKPGPLWPLQIVCTASLFWQGPFYTIVILEQPITSPRWVMTCFPRSGFQELEGGATPRVGIILRGESPQAKALSKWALASDPPLPKSEQRVLAGREGNVCVHERAREC